MKGPYGQMDCYKGKLIRIVRKNFPSIVGKVISVDKVYDTITGMGDYRSFDIELEINNEIHKYQVTPSMVEFADPNEPKFSGCRD